MTVLPSHGVSQRSPLSLRKLDSRSTFPLSQRPPQSVGHGSPGRGDPLGSEAGKVQVEDQRPGGTPLPLEEDIAGVEIPMREAG